MQAGQWPSNAIRISVPKLPTCGAVLGAARQLEILLAHADVHALRHVRLVKHVLHRARALHVPRGTDGQGLRTARSGITCHLAIAVGLLHRAFAPAHSTFWPEGEQAQIASFHFSPRIRLMKGMYGLPDMQQHQALTAVASVPPGQAGEVPAAPSMPQNRNLPPACRCRQPTGC